MSKDNNQIKDTLIERERKMREWDPRFLLETSTNNTLGIAVSFFIDYQILKKNGGDSFEFNKKYASYILLLSGGYPVPINEIESYKSSQFDHLTTFTFKITFDYLEREAKSKISN
jgi:hypothetical protein